MTTIIEYPPGPSKRLPNKLFFTFMRNPIKTLIDITQTYGDISHFKFGKQHIYLVNYPKYIEDILVTNYHNFIKSRGLQLAKRVLGEGLVTSEGDFHHRQRRLIQPVFHPKRIKKYGDVMTNYGVHMCYQWRDGAIVDIHKEMMHVTLAIISKAVLGSDVKLEDDEIGDAILTSMQYFNRLQMPFGELIEKVPMLPANKGFQRARKKLDAVVYRIIKEHRHNGGVGKDGDDLLSTLLHAQDNELGSGQMMTDLQLRDEVMTIFLAGHETTANALTWTFYLLSQYPDVEMLLYKEIDSVIGNKCPSVEDIPKLEYTEKVFTESMRLYPPVWTIGRRAINNYCVDRYIIPAGSVILMSQYVMHHDPRYFPKPDCFDPERWTLESKARLPRFSYFPFGGGIRGCIGEPFAWMEGILLIAAVVQQWKMQLVPGHRVALQPLITLRPKYGMRMKLERRRNTP